MKVVFYISTWVRLYSRMVYFAYSDLFDPELVKLDKLNRFEWWALICLAPFIATYYATVDTRDYLDNFIEFL